MSQIPDGLVKGPKQALGVIPAKAENLLLQLVMKFGVRRRDEALDILRVHHF
jgi:hypothetical protein